MIKRSRFLAGALGVLCAPLPVRAQSFEASLANAISRIPGEVGVCARTMAPGPPLVAYNAQTSFPSASTIKLAIMLTAFRAAEAAPREMDATIVFRRSDLIGGSDFLGRAPDGRRFTVHELILPMIQVSDNTAANLLIAHFGFERINLAARHAGMEHTELKRRFLDYAAILAHMDNRTTPADMALLLYRIEQGAREGLTTVASPQSCNAMIRIMLGQTDRETIPAGVPRGVAVANKTGELSGSRSDVAIVSPYGDSPYVLAVYAAGLSTPQAAYAGVAEISRLVFARVSGSDL